MGLCGILNGGQIQGEFRSKVMLRLSHHQRSESLFRKISCVLHIGKFPVQFSTRIQTILTENAGGLPQKLLVKAGIIP
jgi:hypothetical protein